MAVGSAGWLGSATFGLTPCFGEGRLEKDSSDRRGGVYVVYGEKHDGMPGFGLVWKRWRGRWCVGA